MGNAARWYAALIALAACGGDDAVSVDAPRADAGIDAPPPRLYGSVAVLEYRAMGMDSTLLIAGFGSITSTTFSMRTDGPCEIEKTTNGSAGPNASAGMVTIAGGVSGTILLPQAADKTYLAQQVGYRYAANDMLSVTATGATVPAFSSMVTFPSRLTVTSPTTLTTLSKAGLSVAWTPTTGSVRVFIPQYSTTPDTLITCVYDGAVGSATIPASTLADLAPGMNASVSLSTQATTITAAGPYEVTTLASFSAFSADVTVQP